MIYNSTLTDQERECNFFTKYIVLFVIDFLRIINICSAYFYFYWYLERSDTYVNTSANTNIKIGTTIY